MLALMLIVGVVLYVVGIPTVGMPMCGIFGLRDDGCLADSPKLLWSVNATIVFLWPPVLALFITSLVVIVGGVICLYILAFLIPGLSANSNDKQPADQPDKQG